MSNPFLSIVIPTYKRPHRLKDLLGLLSDQSGLCSEDWEVVVSDNCSLDDTPRVVGSFRDKIPNLRYFQNPENIGADRNISSLYDKASGDYVWLMPDDDLVNGNEAVKKLIDKIRSCPVPPSFVITNAKSVQIDSGEPLKSRFNPIVGDIFLFDGRDILNVVTDFDLIGAQRLVVRRDTLPDDFADRYSGSHVAIVAIALAACTKGPALIVGEPLAVFRAGDPTPWRVYWPSICMQDMPELLLAAVDELGYSAETVSRLIEQRKHKYFARVVHANLLLFQLFDVSWSRLARIYGWPFLIVQIILKAPLAVPMMVIWPWRKKLRKLSSRLLGWPG